MPVGLRCLLPGSSYWSGAQEGRWGWSPGSWHDLIKGTCVVHAVFKQRTGTLSSASGSETRGSPGGVQRTLGAPGCPVPISLSQLSAPALSDLGLDVCWPVQEGDELYTKVAAEPA